MKNRIPYNSINAYIQLSWIRYRYKEHLVFVALSGIGDICYCLSAIQEMKKNSQKKVLVITRKYTAELFSYYGDVDEVLVLNEKDAKAFQALTAMQKNKSVFNEKAKKSGLFFCHPLTEKTYKAINDKNKNYIDIIRNSVTVSETDFPVTYPIVPDVELEKFGFSYLSKTVIINPYSNSLEIHNPNLYKRMVSFLNDEGYQVYTNVTGNQKALEKTTPLICSLKELYHITQRAHLFISIRSGIVDFSINNNGKFIVLYNDETEGWFRDAYSLSGWKTQSVVYEFDHRENEEIMHKIKELC